MKITHVVSQYFYLIMLSCAVTAMHARSNTIPEQFALLEEKLGICRQASRAGEHKEAATEGLDLCGSLRKQVRTEVNKARAAQAAAEKERDARTASGVEAAEYQERINTLEAELAETRESLSTKMNEQHAQHERLTAQRGHMAQWRTKIEQLRKENIGLKLQLQQMQHSPHNPTTTAPAVASNGGNGVASAAQGKAARSLAVR